jgi:hypothetical protein
MHRKNDMEAIIYYRKDPSWLAKYSPLRVPELEGPDSLVEVHRERWWAWNDQSVERNLENIWRELQSDRMRSLPVRLGIRSMMMGDVVAVGDRAWQVVPVGWREIHPQWLVRGDWPCHADGVQSSHEEITQ